MDNSVAKEPKRARGIQRVAELLDAAAALFAEKGYEAVTMTEIAQRAGAAIGSLYQFFPSKGALAEAIFVRYAERVDAATEDIVNSAPNSSPVELADRLVDLNLTLLADRNAAVAMSTSIAGIVERRKPLRDAFHRRIAAALRSANPHLSEKDAAVAAMMIAQITKTVPALAEAEEQSGQPFVAEVRKVLAQYIASQRAPARGAGDLNHLTLHGGNPS